MEVDISEKLSYTLFSLYGEIEMSYVVYRGKVVAESLSERSSDFAARVRAFVDTLLTRFMYARVSLLT